MHKGHNEIIFVVPLVQSFVGVLECGRGLVVKQGKCSSSNRVIEN